MAKLSAGGRQHVLPQCHSYAGQRANPSGELTDDACGPCLAADDSACVCKPTQIALTAAKCPFSCHAGRVNERDRAKQGHIATAFSAPAETRELPTPRETLLERIRVTGWHGTEQLAHLADRLGRAAYRAAWDEGRKAKARGEPCKCIRCWSGEVNV